MIRTLLKFNLTTILLLAIIFTSSVSCVQTPKEDIGKTRIVRQFNDNWRFVQADQEGAEALKYNDNSWRLLDVPHDWSIEGAFDRDEPTGRGGGYLPSGIGWYRKTFDLPKAYENRKVFIHFDGVMANSDVYINGQHLGHRPNGYVSFEYDLTPHLQFGKKNVIAVKADNSKQPASRWFTGAGIYRHVYLVVKNEIHVETWGEFFTTPEVDENQAMVNAKTTIFNGKDAAKSVTLTTIIVDPQGKQAAIDSTVQTIEAQSSFTFEQNISVTQPQLWGMETPQLYAAQTKVSVDGKLIDETENHFGIRTFHFEPATGFYLNGQNIRLKGVCLHHDGGAVGAAVPKAVWEYRLQKLKSIGINAIRLAHNPVAPEFLDLCDEMGFFVMNESFDTWRARKNHADQGYQLHFDQWWEADTRSIVLRDRNHPSIFVFSVGNEIRDNLNNETGFATYKMQHDLIHQLDGTRPVTLALFRPNQAQVYQNGFAEMMDIVGQNYREGELLQASKDNPHWITMGTENGHTRESFLIWRDNPAISAHFLWTGIDYLGEADWPEVSHDYGVFDRAGFEKPRTYQRQSWWSNEPMVRIFRREQHLGQGDLVDDWTPTDFDTYDEAHLEIYTNCDEVEVFLNEKSLGRKSKPADASPIRFQLTYQQGTIKAIGYNNNTEVAKHELQTATAPSEIVITASKEFVSNNWDDAIVLTVTLLDEAGNLSTNNDKLVTFDVSGNGKLIAVDNGLRTDHSPFVSNERRTNRGKAIAIVKATANTGEISIRASATGMGEKTVTVPVK